MKTNFKKYVLACLFLLLKVFVQVGLAEAPMPAMDTVNVALADPVNESAWIDSLIKEGTEKLIAAEQWNQENPEAPVSYLIELDARKWITTDETEYLPVLKDGTWHYEAGKDGDLGPQEIAGQITTLLEQFNGGRKPGDKLRIYSMLIRNFPLKIDNPLAKAPQTSDKNLFNQLVALKAIDKKYYNDIARNTFRAVVDKIVKNAKDMGYQDLIVATVAHMSFRYGLNPADEIKFISVYNSLSGEKVNEKLVKEYLMTDFKRQAASGTSTRGKLLGLVTFLAESVHCVIDGQCEPLAEPGRTFFDTWKNNKKGVSQLELRLIAKYINLCGNELYKDFQTIRPQPTDAWTTVQFDAYKDQLESFVRYYQNFQNELNNIQRPDDMIMICRHLDKNQLESLTADQRLQIIKKINEGPMTDLRNILAYFDNGYGGENVVSNVFKYTPPDQYPAMLEGLKDNVLKFVPKSIFSEWDRLLKEDKVFKCSNDDSFFDGDNFDLHFKQGKLVVDFDDVDGDMEVSPFETIGIITKNALPRLNGLPGISGDYEVAVPALYLYWLKEKESTSRNYQKFELAINVIGFVSGVGMAVEATSWTVRIIGTLDALASATAIGMQVTSLKQRILSQYGKDSKEYAFYQNLELILTIYNGASAAANLVGLPKRLDDAIAFWKANKETMTTKAKLLKEEVDQIDYVLKEANATTDAVYDVMAFVTSLEGDIKKVYYAFSNEGYAIEKVSDILKVYAKNGTDLIAEISIKKVVFKYPGWGGEIVTSSDRTTTCIAKFDDLLDPPGSQFIKYDLKGAFGRGMKCDGGINILDVDPDTYNALKREAAAAFEAAGKTATEAEIGKAADEIFWVRYNLPYLEEAFKRGDDVRLLSDPSTLFGATGFFAREMEVITLGLKDANGIRGTPLVTKYGYRYNDAVKTYEKIR